MANRRLPPLGLLTAVLTALWAGGVAGGFALLDRYESAPGATALPPASWPAASTVRPGAGRPTLLIFAHPQCPCTRATIGELALIMAHSQGRVDAHVLFYKPGGSSPDWEQTGAWRAAGEIPGVRVAVDLDGAEAARFAARTSGATLLYGPDGRLWFRGGITAARGHAGDNPGRSAVVALVNGEPSPVRETPVFGCALSESDADLP